MQRRALFALGATGVVDDLLAGLESLQLGVHGFHHALLLLHHGLLLFQLRFQRGDAFGIRGRLGVECGRSPAAPPTAVWLFDVLRILFSSMWVAGYLAGVTA